MILRMFLGACVNCDYNICMSLNRGNDEVLIPIPKPSPSLSPLLPPTVKVTSQLVQRLRNQILTPPSLPACSSLQEAAEVYQREYTRLLGLNQEANRQLAAVVAERNQLADRYNSLKRAKGSEQYVKRRRREAKDIQREFFCPVDKCRKGYGSEGSLTHHVRLKHKEYFETGEYELFLQGYLEALAQKQGKGDGVKMEGVKLEEKEKEGEKWKEEGMAVKVEEVMKQEVVPPEQPKEQPATTQKNKPRRQSTRVSRRK